MNTIHSRSFRWVTASALALTLTMGLLACGGGSKGGPAVTNLGASAVRFGSLMVVTVAGSGLDAAGLQMTVDGPCTGVARSPGATDFQAVFTCRVSGVGELRPTIRDEGGRELANLRLSVPAPQVSITVQQLTRTGTMVLELDVNAAPITVRNFLAYVNSGFYGNTIFHRVVNGKLAQGGGYEQGPIVKPATGAAIVLESNNGLKNLRGSIGMARTSVPDSATSQFYLNVSDNPEFDFQEASLPGYAVFGRLLSGLEVLDEIGKVEVLTFDNSLPTLPAQDVKITLISQIR